MEYPEETFLPLESMPEVGDYVLVRMEDDNEEAAGKVYYELGTVIGVEDEDVVVHLEDDETDVFVHYSDCMNAHNLEQS